MTKPKPSLDLESLVDRHQAGVWHYLRSLGCDEATADDLTQEVFLGVFRKPFDDYHADATLAYLRTAARQLFLNSLRSRRRRREESFANEMEQEWARCAPDDDGTQYLNHLDHCLDELEPHAREAVTLRYRDDLPRAEMARRMGLAEEGVKTLLRRARERLRACLEQRLNKG